MNEYLKWGLIAVVGFLVLRWVADAFAVEASSLQQTWTAGVANPRLGGGLVFYVPSYVQNSAAQHTSPRRGRQRY